MKLLLDLLPIVLFVVAYKFHGIYVATGVLMAATVVQSAWIWWQERRLTPLQQITLALILVFGALTLLLHDERFVKAKPTVLYGAMALALAVSAWGFRRNVLQVVLGSQLQLPARVWATLNVVWVVYFLFMGALNAWVAWNFTTEQWVDFKLWGYVFPALFVVGQGLYIAPHLKEGDAA